MACVSILVSLFQLIEVTLDYFLMCLVTIYYILRAIFKRHNMSS